MTEAIIAPGKLADFILLSDLEEFTIDQVFKKGAISTLSLPVSPAIKITDLGLIDVNKGELVSLIV